MSLATLSLEPPPAADQIQDLISALAATEAALEAALPDQVDAVINPKTATPMLLHRAQAALQVSEARYRQLLSRMAAIVFELEPDGTILYVNDAVQNATGYPAQELGGRNWWETFFPSEQHRQVDALFAQLQQGDVSNYVLTLTTRSGSLITLELNTSNRYSPAGALQLFLGLGVDVTARRREERGRHFLSEASVALTSSLDYRATLASLAQLAVPTLADWCATNIAAADGSVQQVAITHKDPAKVSWALELYRQYPPEPKTTSFLWRTLQSVKAELFAEITDAMLVAEARDSRHLELMQGIGFTSLMTVPLIARGQTLGTLQFALGKSDHRFDASDLALAEELAHRAAIAVDNSRLYQETREQRERLQITLSSIGDAVIATDARGCVNFMNSVAQSLTGWTLAEAEGVALERVFPIIDATNREPFENPVTRVIREGTVVGLSNNTVLVSRDGTEYYIDNNGAPIRDDAGAIVGVILVFRNITEQRQAQIALRDSEQRFKAIFDQAAVGMVQSTTEGRWVMVNKRLCEMLGYNEQELIGHSLAEFTHPDDLPVQIEQTRRVLAGELRTFSMEKRYIRKDGSYLWANNTASIVRSVADNQDYFVAIVEDISKRKTAEEVLRQSEERFALVFRLSPVAIGLTTAAEGRYLDVNDSLLNLLGYAREEMIGRTADELNVWVTPRQRTEMTQFIRDGGSLRGLEAGFRTKTGEIRTTLTSIEPVTLNSQACFLSIIYDIDERKKAEEVLRQSEERFASVFRLSPVGISISTAVEGRYIDVNDSLLNLMGYSREEMIGRTAEELNIWADPKQRAVLAQAMRQDGSVRGLDVGLRVKTGEVRLTITSVELLDVNGQSCFLAIIYDITERKQAEEVLAGERTLMRTLIDSIPDYVFVKDKESRFVLNNLALISSLAIGPDALIGKTDFDFYPSDRASKFYADDQAVIQSGQPQLNREEFVQDPQTGKVQWLLATKIPLRDPAGNITGLVGISRDITESKIAEEKLRHLNRTLAVLSDVNEAIVRTRHMAELFDKVCHIAVEKGDFRMAWVGLLDAGTGKVNPVAHAGAVEDYLEISGIVLKDEPRGYGPTASALRAGKYVVVNDIEHDPRVIPWREQALRLGYRASAAFPLKVAGKVEGNLNLYADTAAFFDDAELKLLEEMVDDISFAMEFAEQETRRQQAEIALKMHMQAVEEMGLFLQTTFDSFPAHAVVLAADGTILNVNAPWIHFGDDNGASAAMHFVGTNYLRICDRAAGPDSAEAKPAAAGIRSVIAGEATEFNLEYPCNGNSEARCFTMRVTAFPEPAPRRVVVAHINITERKQAEEGLKNEHALLEERVITRTAELQTTKERVEAILNNSADAIVLVHRDFRIQQTSASFNSMFHCAEDEYFGQVLNALVISSDREGMNRIFQAAAEKRKLTVDVEAQRKDGKVFAAELNIGLINDDSFVCTFHDINERKQVEQSLRAAIESEKEMNELKSRFVSMASHEFRTPLATILATTETLTAYYDRMERSQIDARFDKIRQQIRHMTDIMENMLQLTRIQSGRVDFKPEPGQLDLLCDEIVDEFASHPLHKGRLLYSCEERPVLANFDGRLMRQIINNLISNALKYSPKESLVRIELIRDDIGAILKVKDEGIGIPADDLKRLFEPFHRASNVGTISGTGLGLIITKEAIELHGGTITIDSEVDKGTQFTVILPNRRQNG